MSDSDKKPAEFFSDEHKESHVAALTRELEGYEAKAKAGEESGNETAKATYDRRADQVKSELKRLGAEAKTGRQRAASR